MKLSITSVVLFAAGVILIYSAVKDKAPQEVIRVSLAGQSPATAKASPSSTSTTAPSIAPIPNTPQTNGPNVVGA